MLNLNSLKEIVGHNHNMMRDLLIQFLETTQKDMVQLQEAIVMGSSRNVASVAHKIKGSCFVIGAHRLADLMGTLERTGRDDNKKEFVELSELAKEELVLIRQEIEGLIG